MAINYKYPSGMIAPFDTTCPSGWSIYGDLDTKLPRGSSAGGASGGNTSHRHEVNPGTKGIINTYGTIYVTAGTPLRNSSEINHLHTINLPATYTSFETVWPPYVNVVFCKKD